MKTKSDLLKLALILIEKSKRENNTIWVEFSGHVNQLSIRFYPAGYDHSKDNDLTWRKCECYLEKENEVQMMYYWILSNFPESWFK